MMWNHLMPRNIGNRRCRWFGHRWRWPWQPRGVDVPFAGFCPTGGLWMYCERCGTRTETHTDMVLG